MRQRGLKPPLKGASKGVPFFYLRRNKMAKLLSGNSDDIIKENQKMLRNEGISEAQSMHLALKHSNKGKAADRAVKGVIKKSKDRVEVK